MSTARLSTNDQRTHERFSADTRLVVIGPGGKEVQLNNGLVNISEGGMLFYANDALSQGLSLEIHLDFPAFHSSIEVGGRVMWSQRATQKANAYFVGIEFIGIEDADQELIAEIRKKDAEKQKKSAAN